MRATLLAPVLAPAGPAWSLDTPPSLHSPVAHRLLRPLALGLAADFADAAVGADAVALLLGGAATPGSPSSLPPGDPDIRAVLYSAAVGASADAFDAVRDAHEAAAAAGDPAAASSALAALAHAQAATGPRSVRAALDYSLTGAVRAQDASAVAAAAAARGGAALDAALDWLLERRTDIAAKAGGGGDGERRLGNLLVTLGGSLAGPRAAARVAAAAKKLRLPEPRYATDALARVEESGAWLEDAGGAACDWLAQQTAATG